MLQKIEIIDDEESDMISNSEGEQVNSFLDYKVKVVLDSEVFKRFYCKVTMYQFISLPFDKLSILGLCIDSLKYFDINRGPGHFN